jgi:NAD(P)H dehydrogenase (quinone)
MNVLILHAHPEPKSFNAAMTDLAVATLTAAGHEVRVSDLNAMGWNPVSDRRNFVTVADADFYRQQREEALAVAQDGFAPDIRAEMEKVVWCDLLIAQFPLWWFGLPAIAKGWFDRVLAMDFAYGGGRLFDQGPFVGKRALLSLTTGGAESMYGEGGRNGTMEAMLYPIHHGIRFTGFEVLPPHVAYAINHVGEDGRQAALDAYAERLRRL